MMDSEQIFGVGNLTKRQLSLAKKKYEQKWSAVYPLRKEVEPWLFGRGQDDMEDIKEVQIEKISNLKYRVFVDYNDSYRTINEITLVKNNTSYLIGYCATDFLE